MLRRLALNIDAKQLWRRQVLLCAVSLWSLPQRWYYTPSHMRNLIAEACKQEWTPYCGKHAHDEAGEAGAGAETAVEEDAAEEGAEEAVDDGCGEALRLYGFRV
jgi:hypothetical protein